jgi:8-oxo-dGTP pyrophosphatase MutT (NUDIX family)
MTITREDIRAEFDDYLMRHPEDSATVVPVLALLDAGADLVSRAELRGHVTAGAVAVNDRGQVLHIFHKSLGRWLLPGGHLEPTDESLRAAALRELTEETGLAAETVASLEAWILHVDVHPIPAAPNKGEGAHRHIDARFVFRVPAQVGSLQVEEVTAAAWRDASELADPVLRRRVTALTEHLS